MWPFKSRNDESINYDIKAVYIPETKERPPERDEESLERITPEDAIALMNRDLPLENKRVTGDLILGRRDLENPFEFDTEDGRKVQAADLPGRQDFARLHYRSRIEVRNCVFEGKLILAGMEFKQDVHFLSTRFLAELDLQFAVFDRALTFHGCHFQDRVSFSDSTFWEYAHFDRTVFTGPADFFNTSFLKGASYKYAVFHSSCTYTSSRFCSSMLPFPCLDFGNTVCHEAAYFMDARFDGIADFGGVQFRRKVDFVGASFKYINLRQAQFGWLEIKWEQIGHKRLLFGTVTVKGFDVSRAYVSEGEFNKSFLRRMDTPLSEKHRQYDILKGVFLKQGDFVSADQCFYDWKQIERKESGLGWNPESWIVKLFHYLNWLSCGYGVKPIRTLFFASISILLFGIVYTVINPAFDPFYKVISLNRVFLNSLLVNIEYSFLVFMNFTSLTAQAGLIQHLLYLVERILGWITLLLFVTTYTRIMLR